MELIKIIGEEAFNALKTKLGENGNLLDNLDVDMSKGEFIPKAKFNDVNEKLKTSQATIQEMEKSNKDNESIKKSVGEWKQKYEDLDIKYKTENQQRVLDEALLKAGGKNPKSIKGLIDSSKITFTEDGKVEGLDAQIEALKKSDSYLFAETKTDSFGKNENPGESDNNKMSSLEEAFARLNPGIKF